MSKRKVDYPIGSISSGTMRPEDLIPTFAAELHHVCISRRDIPAKIRSKHYILFRVITGRLTNDSENYFDTDGSDAEADLDALFDALQEYAGPYFYFGAHPGNGSDYGYWLGESFADDFDGLKVSDLSEVPSSYRGEVLLVNDHGNISLYVKSARKLREIWSVV